MSTVIPSAPPIPVAAQPAAAQALTVLTSTPPAQLAALPSGAAVEAVVQMLAGRNQVEVSTPFGTLSLKTSGLALPQGASLLLQMQPHDGTAPLSFRILGVNGRPLPLAGAGLGALLQGGGATLGGLLAPGSGAAAAAGSAPSLLSPAPPMGAGGAQGAAAVPGGAVSVHNGVGLQATLLRPAAPSADGVPLPGQAPLPAALTGLPQGSQLTIRLLSVAPAAGGGGAPGPEMPSAGAGAPAAGPASDLGPAVPRPAAASAATPPTGPAASLPAGGGAAPAAAATGAPAPLPSSASPTLLGQVVAHPPGGAAVVQTQIGLLSVHAGASLPQGASVMLEVVGPPRLPPASSAAAAPAAGLGASGWPAASEALGVLNAADPQAAAQLARILPQIGPRLAASLSAFAGAVRAGDVRLVSGEGLTRGLDKAGRRDLADKLKGDLDDASKDAARSCGGGDWRGMTLPVLHGAVIDPVRLYVRKPPGEEEQRGGGSGGQEQRFLLDVTMSRLGRIQLDGLVLRDDKRFDLIIRTAQPFDEETRHHILGLFAECGQLTGTKGSVAFQSGGRFVDLPPDPPAATSFTV